VSDETAVIVLAAGGGTRMKSAVPKALHEIGGRSMIGHVLAAAAPLQATVTSVVVGHDREQMIPALEGSGVGTVVQEEQNGTGHATRLALDEIPDFAGTVLVLTGDTPLLTADALQRLITEHRAGGAAATLLTAQAPDPQGYGRIIRDESGSVRRIVEQRDASETERAVHEINTAVAAYTAPALRDALKRLSADNAAGEEYLTDVVGIFVADGRRVGAVSVDIAETVGVNDRVQLAEAGRLLRDRVVRGWMQSGVTVVDPETTWIDVEVTLSRDVIIHPNVQLHGTTTIGEAAEIGPDCTLRDTFVGAGATVIRTQADSAEIGPAAQVGPFAYLRPGARLARKAKVGTYVEVKNADIGEGSKVPHLSYVGDATIGSGVNIGAASVFVNYDGVTKRRSEVGDGARTGADNMFVAPVRVGAGAYTGAGAVIREDVPAGALAVSAGVQRIIEGWTERKRPGTPSAEAAAAARKSETDSSAGNQASDSNHIDNRGDGRRT
jgi:bifunctional UDP-N-acetylglucosamine pyrophosphorylase/glucosamine-1-phosphate N-acetyltransferase